MDSGTYFPVLHAPPQQMSAFEICPPCYVRLMGVGDGGGWRGVDLIDAPPAMLFTDSDRPPRLSLFPLHNQILPHYAFS